MGKASQTSFASHKEHPSFETVWAILQEVGKKQDELTESQKETDRIVRENACLIGKLGNRFGEMVEYMVMPRLVERFRELSFEFTKAYPETEIKDIKNNIITEVDITLENGDKVMIIEVKSKPTTKDINDHIKRMEKVKAHAKLHNDNRIYLGAIAGMVIKKTLNPYNIMLFPLVLHILVFHQ